ncbi:MAG: ferritin family protein [Desulfosarcinaceae bacterium]
MLQTSLDILKEAILLERRGRAFYLQVAAQSQNPPIKEFFETMAAEEKNHMQVLGEQYKNFSATQTFAPLQAKDADSQPLPGLILTREVKEKIAAADFEAAAISAAMLLEEQAVKLYGDRAADAKDPNEKALFEWLAHWEQSHLSFLTNLDHDIKEAIWEDNRFWPF